MYSYWQWISNCLYLCEGCSWNHVLWYYGEWVWTLLVSLSDRLLQWSNADAVCVHLFHLLTLLMIMAAHMALGFHSAVCQLLCNLSSKFVTLFCTSNSLKFLSSCGMFSSWQCKSAYVLQLVQQAWCCHSVDMWFVFSSQLTVIDLTLIAQLKCTGWAKNRLFLKACNSRICWHRKAFCISNCSVSYLE